VAVGVGVSVGVDVGVAVGVAVAVDVAVGGNVGVAVGVGVKVEVAVGVAVDMPSVLATTLPGWLNNHTRATAPLITAINAISPNNVAAALPFFEVDSSVA